MPTSAPATLAEALALTDEARVITCAAKPYKIMHTNAAWSKLTGFKFVEAAGKTCSLLQGPATEANVLAVLEAGVSSGVGVHTIRITNYTAAGVPFRNTLSIRPLHDAEGACQYFVATLSAAPIMDGSVEPVPQSLHASALRTAGAWAALRRLDPDVNSAGGEDAQLIDARIEAARKIIDGHERLLLDVTNPSPTANIDGAPLTQLQLTRVDPADASHVDAFLREVSRRLLGCQPGSTEDLEELVDPSSPRQAEAWLAAAAYLEKRIHSHPQQLQGRTPDMRPAAAEAMKAAMAEVAGEAAAWEALRGSLSDFERDRLARQRFEEGCSPAPLRSGAAAAHDAAACGEAARKLIFNHAVVLRDITNPRKAQNIHRKLLTQQHLTRLPIEARPAVDAFLLSLARRLLGLEEPAAREQEDEAAGAHAAAWVAAATFLSGRIHSEPAAVPGRTPDMSRGAAAAMRDVLREMAAEQEKHASARKPCTHYYSRAVAPPPPSSRLLKRKRTFTDIFTAFNEETEAIVFTEPVAPFRITHANAAWCDMCGYSLEEIEGATNALLQGPDTDLSVVADLMRSVRRSEPAIGTVVNYKKGGERFVNQVQIEPLCDEDDNIAQFMAILHEIDMTPASA